MDAIQEPRPKFVKLSKFHKEATNYLSQYLQFKGKFAKLVPTLDEGATRNQRFFMNGVFNFLKQMEPHINTIEKIVEKLGLTGDKFKMNKSVAMVISWDLIQNGFEIDRFSKPSNAASLLLKFNDEIINEFHNGDYSRPKEVVLPRWAKVNSLLSKVSEVKEQLDKEFWVEVNYDNEDYDDFIGKLQSLNNSEYLVDFHVKDLLAFPSHSPLKFSEVSKNNHIILQDKASCLPVSVSGVLPGMCVLDACAAPGNKSIHLACVMNNKGKLFCNELSSDRFQILKDRCKLYNVKCAQFWNSDFTEISQYDLLDIHTVILDPSCSNSGTSRYETEDSVSSKRIDNLQCVQRKLLNHALCLPNVQVVVYSTCSIHCQENEEIVANALQKFGHKFELADLSETLIGWRTKGLKENPKTGEVYDFADKVLRTDPNVDCCHGFFVAKFVAKNDDVAENDEYSYDNVTENVKFADEDNDEYSTHENGTENAKSIDIDNDKYSSTENDHQEMENVKEYQNVSIDENDSNERTTKKKKKKRKTIESEYEVEKEKSCNESFTINDSCKETSKKRKKSKAQANENDINSESVEMVSTEMESIEEIDLNCSLKKKKKKRSENNDEGDCLKQSKYEASVEFVETSEMSVVEPPRKRKKKRYSEVNDFEMNGDNSKQELELLEEGDEKRHKKNKKSKSNSMEESPKIKKSKKNKLSNLDETEEKRSDASINDSVIDSKDELRVKKKKSKKHSLDLTETNSMEKENKKHKSEHDELFSLDGAENIHQNGHKKKKKKSKKSSNED